ncbi:dihydropteroate synthase [Candidatus Peregrinibacteria bacterium]|nr:dihydropteroate synthase [Candidatus Peregrinibacteria bacterium]
MGVLNLTPDSFSDGGEYNTLEKALHRAKQIEEEGADIIDIGGESTGPNSKYIPLERELKRVIPILKKIKRNIDIPISIDTYKSEVARQAVEEGADIVNDVTALRQDPKMVKIIKRYKCPLIIMYSKDNTPRTTIQNKNYKDVIKIIKLFLEKRINYAENHGIDKKQIIIDPGLGNFISKIPKYSFEIIARLNELRDFGNNILIGASRKSFLGGEFKERDIKGIITAGIAYLNGASIIRTHNIKDTKEFFKKFNG